MEVFVPTLPAELDLPKPYVVPFPEQYFPLPTLISAVGPRGKGKTYGLSLWNKWMFDHCYFTRFYAIDPTYESNDSVQVLPLRPGDLYTDANRGQQALLEIIQKVTEQAEFYKEMTEVYPEKYQEYLDEDRNVSKMDQNTVRYLREKMKVLHAYYDELEEVHAMMNVRSMIIEYELHHRETSPYLRSEMIVGKLFDEMHPWFPAPPKLVRPVPLLFLDDLSHTEIYSTSRDNPMNNLTLRHRHLGGKGYGVTIEFATQTFRSGLQKALRENTQQFLLFETRDKGVIESMYEGVGNLCTEEEFTKLYNHATAEDHGFLLVDNNTKDKNRIFRKGWDTFLVDFVNYEDHRVNVTKTVKRINHKKRNLDDTEGQAVTKKKRSRKEKDKVEREEADEDDTSNLCKKRKRKSK